MPVVHDGALDGALCSVSTGWRFMLNKRDVLWILAAAASKKFSSISDDEKIKTSKEAAD